MLPIGRLNGVVGKHKMQTMDIVCPCSFIIKKPFKSRDSIGTTKWFPLAKIPFLAYRHVKRNQPSLSNVRNLVFLSVHILRELQVASGSWVLVWKRSEKGVEPLHYAKIFATELVFESTLSEATTLDNVKQLAWISPNLFYLSYGANLISIESIQRRKPCEATEFFPFQLRGLRVPTASELYVARVKDGKPLQEWEDCFVSYCLKKYFNRPKLLKLGEVFAIFTTHDSLMEWLQHLYGLEKVPPFNLIDFEQYHLIDSGKKIFFFRVEKLLSTGFVVSEDEPAVVDPTVTKVSQLSGICSMLPLDIYLFELQEYHLTENVEILSKHSSFSNPEQFGSLKTMLENYFTKRMSTNLGCKSFSCSVLLHGPNSVEKHSFVHDVCYSLGLPVFDIDCLRFFATLDNQQDSFSHVEFLSLLRERYLEFQPCVLLLRNLEVLDSGSSSTNTNSARFNWKTRLFAHLEALLNDRGQEYALRDLNSQSIIFGTCERADDLNPQLRALFLYEVEVSLPNEDIRKQYLQVLLREVPKVGRISTELAVKYGKTLRSYSDKLLYFWSCHVMLNCLKSFGIESPDRNVAEDAMLNATKKMEERTNMSVVKSSLRVPKVTWEDIGGLSNVREIVMESIQLPLVHPELYENLSQVKRRSGLLFYGPPGTGKTLLAKAIANECGCSFLSVKGPELMNMYVGESERNIRDIFSKAREAAPCVIFFDELDSLAPMRGQSSDGGGVMDRVVSQLLTEMDDLHSNNKKTKQKSPSSFGVIIVGATNRPDLLDSALLRPGRFDKLVYIGSPETKEARFEVLRALTRSFVLSEDVDLMTLASSCPKIVSGADLYGLCADAWLFAAKRAIRIHEGHHQSSSFSEEPLQVVVCQQDFLDANSRLVPSLSEEMLRHYKLLVKRFSSTE